MKTSPNWFQNGKGNMFFHYFTDVIIYLAIVFGIAWFFSALFIEVFYWLPNGDYINKFQPDLINLTVRLGVGFIVGYAIMVALLAYIVLIIIQKKIITLLLPKKQKLEKVISFVSAMDKLEISSTKDSIDFILKNRIKVYVVDEPFDKKNIIRENCYVKFVYYAMDRTYLNRGKLEQYIGKNVLCFEYNDFLSYDDILKNYKNEILQKALEENSNKFNQEIYKICKDYNEELARLKEKYEKKEKELLTDIELKDKAIQEELIYKNEYKNQKVQLEKEKIELQAVIEKLQSENSPEEKIKMEHSPFYFVLLRTYQDLKNKNFVQKYNMVEIEKHFWNMADNFEKKYPNIKREIMSNLTYRQQDKTLRAEFPERIKQIVKVCFADIRQTDGGRPSSKSPDNGKK